MAEEFRRLSDMAVTAHEHVDLRLTDLSVQVDSLRINWTRCSAS